MLEAKEDQIKSKLEIVLILTMTLTVRELLKSTARALDCRYQTVQLASISGSATVGRIEGKRSRIEGHLSVVEAPRLHAESESKEQLPRQTQDRS